MIYLDHSATTPVDPRVVEAPTTATPLGSVNISSINRLPFRGSRRNEAWESAALPPADFGYA